MHVNDSQREVLSVLNKYGPVPDSALVPLAQHFSKIHQSSSGIRTRRKELVQKNMVKQVDSVMLPSGRPAAVWAVTA